MSFRPMPLIAALALAVAATGCASKKTEDVVQPVAPQPVQPVQTAPAEEPAAVESTDLGSSLAPISWEGFESNPANYTGDTRTRVIYFAFDRSEIPAAAYDSLKAHAGHLAANGNARLRLEGHADERGTPEYNVALAERRGKAVQQFLVLNGAKASQLEMISYGEEKPAVLGSDELSWAKNRRVELVYTAGQP